MKAYIINTGCSFRVSDTKVLQGGDRIELEDDVAQAHADKVTPAPEEPQGDEDGEAAPLGGGIGGGAPAD